MALTNIFATFLLTSRLHEQCLYVITLICHIKANTPAFQHMIYLSHKNWPISLSTRANENCHINLARVDEALDKLVIYNNCLIPRALIGSFLSSIRVQTDKILIYASFQVQLSAVKLSTF